MPYEWEAAPVDHPAEDVAGGLVEFDRERMMVHVEAGHPHHEEAVADLPAMEFLLHAGFAPDDLRELAAAMSSHLLLLVLTHDVEPRRLGTTLTYDGIGLSWELAGGRPTIMKLDRLELRFTPASQALLARTEPGTTFTLLKVDRRNAALFWMRKPNKKED